MVAYFETRQGEKRSHSPIATVSIFNAVWFQNKQHK